MSCIYFVLLIANITFIYYLYYLYRHHSSFYGGIKNLTFHGIYQKGNNFLNLMVGRHQLNALTIFYRPLNAVLSFVWYIEINLSKLIANTLN